MVKYMEVKLANTIYPVTVVRKMGNRNTYLRIKEDLSIYVTTNTFVTNREIEKIILKNEEAVLKMIAKEKRKYCDKREFYYLGKKYDLILTNEKGVNIGLEKIFVNRDIDVDKWLKKQAEVLFKERLDYWYRLFTRKIPYPKLTIRKMKSRWGVCNTKDIRVTLNLELMKKLPQCLDYVIVHELSHLIHPNHSKDFWSLVEENYPNYKIVRKIMKE